MLSNIISSLCSCIEQNEEKSAVRLNIENKQTNLLNLQPTTITEISNFSMKRIGTIVTHGTHLGMHFRFENSKINVLKNQSCKNNLVKIRTFQEEENIVKKKRLQHKLRTENEYFQDFQKKVDSLISESLDIKSVSESDDSGMSQK
jgi:hypothetical protein